MPDDKPVEDPDPARQDHEQLNTPLVCPVCGAKLVIISCKKYCTRRPECGYFESCSEF